MSNLMNSLYSQAKMPPFPVLKGYFKLEIRRIFRSFRFPFLFCATFILLFMVFVIISATFTRGFSTTGAQFIGSLALEDFYDTISIPILVLISIMAFVMSLNMVSYLFRSYIRNNSDLLIIDKQLSRFWIINLRNLAALIIVAIASLVVFFAYASGSAFMRNFVAVNGLNNQEIFLRAFNMGGYFAVIVIFTYLVDLAFVYIYSFIGIILNVLIILVSFVSPIVQNVETFVNRSRDPIQSVLMQPNDLNNNSSQLTGLNTFVTIDPSLNRLNGRFIDTIVAPDLLVNSSDFATPSTYYIQPLSFSLIGQNIVYGTPGVSLFSAQAASREATQKWLDANVTISLQAGVGERHYIANFNRIANSDGTLEIFGKENSRFPLLNSLENQNELGKSYDATLASFIENNPDLFRISNNESFYAHWMRITTSQVYLAFRLAFFESLAMQFESENALQEINNRLDVNTFYEEAFLDYLFTDYALQNSRINNNRLINIDINDPIANTTLFSIAPPNNNDPNNNATLQNVTYGNILGNVLSLSGDFFAFDTIIPLVEVPNLNDPNSLALFSEFQSSTSKGYQTFGALYGTITLTAILFAYYRFMFKKGY